MDRSNLEWAELCFGRLQVIERVHREEAQEAEGGSHGRVSPKEVMAFSGTARTPESLMVRPDLLSHVQGVVETIAEIMVGPRLARKEQGWRQTKAEARGAQGGASVES